MAERQGSLLQRLASWLSTGANLVTTPWGAVVTAIDGFGASLAVAMADWGPKALVFIWTFVGFMVAVACLVWLFTRRQPLITQPYQDYRYGLTFNGANALFNPVTGTLQLGLAFINHAAGPIKYTIEHFDVRLESRALPRYVKGHLNAYLPRGGAKMSVSTAFAKNEIAEFFGKSVSGTAEASVSYGHPEKAPERLLKLNLILSMHISQGTPNPTTGDVPPPQVLFSAMTGAEIDEALSVGS
jgi:hypothetical protein